MRSRLAACVLLAACTGAPDVVGRSVAEGTVIDAGADTGSATLDAGAPPPADGGMTCDFDEALRNANLPAELLLVAVTCSVPLSWFNGNITGIDWLALLEPFLGGTILPPGEAREADACDLAGVFYYQDPDNPDNVKLCDSVCIPLQNRVVASSGKVGCTRDALPEDDAGGL